MCLLCASNANAQNLIVNGDFGTGDLTECTTTPTTPVTIAYTGAEPSTLALHGVTGLASFVAAAAAAKLNSVEFALPAGRHVFFLSVIFLSERFHFMSSGTPDTVKQRNRFHEFPEPATVVSAVLGLLAVYTIVPDKSRLRLGSGGVQ